MAELIKRQRHSAFGLSIRQLDIAVVDDDTLMLKFASAVLERLGVARVRVFTSAVRAFPAMMSEPPNLVFIDWMMKPVDGCALLRRMRLVASAPLCFVPAIMASAHATRPFVEKALLAGAHQIIAKPMLEESIAVRVKAITEDSRVFVKHDDRYFVEGVKPPDNYAQQYPAEDMGDDSNVWQL